MSKKNNWRKMIRCKLVCYFILPFIAILLINGACIYFFACKAPGKILAVINLGKVSAGESIKRTIVLKNSGNKRRILYANLIKKGDLLVSFYGNVIEPKQTIRAVIRYKISNINSEDFSNGGKTLSTHSYPELYEDYIYISPDCCLHVKISYEIQLL